MANTNKEVAEDKFETIESALSRTERYIEENQKSLTIIVVAILAAVGIYFGFTKWYLKPLEEEAQKQMFVAQQYFKKDSFNIALNGNGSYPGFLMIIDDYGLTKSAKLAHYYAGICYKNLGKYNEAIEYLKKFDSDDKMISNIALGSIGDCYAELGNVDEAVKYYQRGAENNDNDLTSPIYLMRAGVLLEQKGEYSKAVSMYEKIQKDYTKTYEGQQIEKYIARAKLKGNLK
jgi:tetratricopeptide (TPR) repeat protein